MNSRYNTGALFELVEAIVRQAAEDYRKALKRNNTQMISDCERFFRGKWFADMGAVNIDPEKIIKQLREEVKK